MDNNYCNTCKTGTQYCMCGNNAKVSESAVLPGSNFVVEETDGRILQITEYYEDIKDAEAFIEHFSSLPSWKGRKLRIVQFVN